MNKGVLITGIAAITIGAIVYFTRGCKVPDHQKPQKADLIDSLTTQKVKQVDGWMIERDQILHRVDSLKSRLVDARNKWRTHYDTIYLRAPDTCKEYMEAVYVECERLDSSNQKVITEQGAALKKDSTIIGGLNDVITLKNYKIAQKNDTIAELKQDLKTSKKETRRAKIGGWFKTAGATLGSFYLGRVTKQ